MRRADERSVPLVGLPEGLTAHAVRAFRPGNEGTPVTIRDRRGRQKLDEVELISENPLDDERMNEADRRFLLGTHRRSWETVASRYGDETWAKAVQFARQGAIAIRCTVKEDLTLGQPIGWRLTDQWAEFRTRQESEDDARKSHWRLRAESTANLVEALSPELAQALRATQPSQKLQVLVFAAEDLLNGMVHTGPRAFSQAHFGATKKGPDVLALLREANLEIQLLTRLGIDRTAYIGVAGPIQAVTPSGAIEIQIIRGPVLVRGDRSLQLKLTKEFLFSSWRIFKPPSQSRIPSGTSPSSIQQGSCRRLRWSSSAALPPLQVLSSSSRMPISAGSG